MRSRPGRAATAPSGAADSRTAIRSARARCDTSRRPSRARPARASPAARAAGARGSTACASGLARLVADEVTDAADVLDELATELAAQLVDVDRDSVALDLLAPAVETVFDLRARQQRAGALHQRLQHRELACRQQHGHAVARDLPRARVERDAAEAQRA